jgi:hypothetical protein
MTKIEAICNLISDAQAAKLSMSSYNRVMRACIVLELTQAETDKVLAALEYHIEPGQPMQWLMRAIAEKSK